MNDREVAEYLLANPEFFAEHAEMLATIRLANPHGKAAVSLQERQMEMLRDKNKHLERRLAELLRYGHENDSIASKFNRWTIRVMAERDPYALPRTISNGLRDIFDVPQAALRVWDVSEPYAQAEFARHVGEEVRIFANSLTTPYCGANTGFEAAQWLVPAVSAVSDGRVRRRYKRVRARHRVDCAARAARPRRQGRSTHLRPAGDGFGRRPPLPRRHGHRFPDADRRVGERGAEPSAAALKPC